MDRRRFLEIAAVSSLSALAASRAAAKDRVINDVSQLNSVRIAEERRPRSTDEVRAALRAWSGSVSVGGGRFSMGGQIAAIDSLHLDMRAMKQLVSFDAPHRRIRVQAGMTWRDLQDVIDPSDLSVKIMQSYSNFTVGGSVSVNCHGRYVGRGPLANSVQALQLVTAEGEVLKLTRSQDRELFRAVFGGYGGLGVITEIELELEANARIELLVQDVALDRYPAFFREKVLPDARIVLHNADLTPPNFAAPRAISWVTTDKPLTQADRLIPRGLDYNLEKNAIWAITELPGGDRLRESIVGRRLETVTWRNYEASLDTASLEPRTRSVSTYLLQEYFIPVGNFQPFAQEMARILKARKVNALNVSIRHSPADTESLMKWAPTEVFAFVIYYKQRNLQQASDAVGVWTRELIDAALANGGRYYLPYRLDATRAQFERAYPEARAFAALKAHVDPSNRFRNLLWDKYLPPA
jgi:FAD/FMN-containing dehydrogenase